MSSSAMADRVSKPVPAKNGGAAPSASEPAIRVANLGKRYEIYEKPLDRLRQMIFRGRRQFFREFWALRGVSFDVHRGESVGIIGRNGSGKSTLLQMIAGTLRPTEGALEVRGRVAALLELGAGFNLEFTGRENVYMNGAILGLSQSQIEARFDDIAAFADIGDFLDMPVKTYSSGMFVRLAFAVQAQLEPDVLIVDEALAVGDAAFQRKCYRRLEELRAAGVAFLFVSHSLELVRSLCDSAVYLERGAPKAIGPANDVCDAYWADLVQEQSGRGANKAAAAGSAADSRTPAHALDRWSPQSPSAAAAQGSRVVEFLAAEIAPEAPGRAAIMEGERLRLRVRLRTSDTVGSFVFGVLIRDRVGTAIFGFSKPSADLGWRNLRPGEEFELEASLRCALGPDAYFLTLGLQSADFGEVYHYLQDALHFTLEAPPPPGPVRLVTGVARLDFHVLPLTDRDGS